MNTKKDSIQSAIDEETIKNSLGEMLSELKSSEERCARLLSEINLAQDELAIKQANFNELFKLSPIAYFIVNNNGIIKQANQKGLALLVASKSQISGKKFNDFIIPAYKKSFYSFLAKLTTGEKQITELKLKANNTEIPIKIEGFVLSNSLSGEIHYCLTVVHNDKIAAQKLVETSQRLALTLSASGTGTWTIDLHKNHVFLDDFSLSLLDVHPWDFDNSIKKFLEIVHVADQQLVKQHLLNCVQNDQKIDVEFRIKTKEGEIKTIVAKGHQVPDREYYFAGIIIDITDKKKIAEAAQQLFNEKQKLVLSTALIAQEKERQRISGVLHDSICQLLYGIRLNLQSLDTGDQSNNEFKAVNELLTITIQQTRDLSYELTPSVLRDFGFVEGVKEMVQRLNTPQFRITTQIQKSTNLLEKDLQLSVFRIVQELLNNCIKHAEANMVHIAVNVIDKFIMITVTDNGIGFNLFKNKSSNEGSGLRDIKNRVFLLNGEFNLKSDHTGTLISIFLINDSKPL